ncbi:hypothetical protein M3J09_004278 [Ascochyta lentis]
MLFIQNCLCHINRSKNSWNTYPPVFRRPLSIVLEFGMCFTLCFPIQNKSLPRLGWMDTESHELQCGTKTPNVCRGMDGSNLLPFWWRVLRSAIEAL